MKIRQPQQELYGVNVIPIVDMMTILLIFFMLTTRFANIERDVRVHPPASRDARPITEIPMEIVVNVTRDGAFVIASRQYTIEEVDSLLEAAVKKDPGQHVIIRGDQDAILQFAVNILDLCEKNGIENTYLTTRKPGT